MFRFLAIPLCLAAWAADVDTSSSELRPYMERYVLDRGNLQRTYNVELSPRRAARMKEFYREWLDTLAALNFERLSQDGKVDYVLFRNFLEREAARLDLDAKAQAEFSGLVPFASVIIDLEEARRRMEPVQAQAAAATLTQLARLVDEAKRAAESSGRGQPAHERRVLHARAGAAVNSLRTSLRQWYGFYNGYDPLFTWWNEQPYKAADTALQNYASVLRPARADEIVGNPIGRDGLLAELRAEMIPYTPEELIAIANKEFAWCEGEMKKAAREMGFGDDWKRALEKVKTMHVEPGRQPQIIRDLALEAEKFLDEHDLVTVPKLARETWRMEMMSAERQLVNPFFTGGEVISVSFPTSSMTYEQKMMSMRGNNVPMSRATVFHELIPGHHLQLFMGARYKPYRSQIGGTPFITEGWALYWELLLYDMKFQKTPEDRVGALFWRMHRCARIIFSLSFHMGKMTPEECINFLVDRVGHERDNATGEVRRSFGGGYGPLYQAAYLLGGMQIYALHKELVGSGKMTVKQFNDAILKENRLPVELLRASLAKLPLSRDYTTRWKFYGENPGQ